MVASLVFLALLPLFIHRLISNALDEVSEVTEPTRTALSDLQVALAREAAGTRGFLLTGDEQNAANYHEAQAMRVRAFSALTARAHVLGGRFEMSVRQVATELRAADELVDALYTGAMSREAYIAALPEQQGRLLAVTEATTELQRELQRRAGGQRDGVREIHRLDALLSLAGVLLAFAAMVAVARLSTSYRVLADRERAARASSERALADAERRRLEVARLNASHAGLIRGFSHDVRNPLGAADGYLRLLEMGVLEPLTVRQRDAVEHARRSLAAAIQLIRELLDLARTEVSDIDVHPVPADLEDVARLAVDDYRAQADSKGLVLAVPMTDAMPPVQSDPVRVLQVSRQPAEQRDQVHRPGQRHRACWRALRRRRAAVGDHLGV